MVHLKAGLTPWGIFIFPGRYAANAQSNAFTNRDRPSIRMSSQDIYLEEEVFIIEDSGEMPEVAMHSSIHFLSNDPDGPGLTLAEDDLLPLKKAVVNRYQTIILRDLNPANRTKSIYRGLQRSAVNWQRMKLFAERENLEIDAVRHSVGRALTSFLEAELHRIAHPDETTCINCSMETLHEFAADVGIERIELVHEWRQHSLHPHCT